MWKYSNTQILIWKMSSEFWQHIRTTASQPSLMLELFLWGGKDDANNRIFWVNFESGACDESLCSLCYVGN
jgi:hypothetical protein